MYKLTSYFLSLYLKFSMAQTLNCLGDSFAYSIEPNQNLALSKSIGETYVIS
jgi:hypothetical protein